MQKVKKRKLIFRILTGILLLTLLLIIISNYTINNAVEGKNFSQISKVPYNRVGLVLGTAKKLMNGTPNPYYSFRIAATLELFHAKKIEFVLVSGDNGTQYYNEPKSIKNDLVAGGIPKEKIVLDYAGFRTLDSMVRAREVFGLETVTVISQKFHTQRAIYIAHKKGLEAVGYNAKDVRGNSGIKVQLREYLARVKVFVDLLLNIQPKFYGERITIK